MAKFKFGVVLSEDALMTARLADGPGATNLLNDNDNGKFLKLVGDSQYGLCAVGDPIEAVMATGVNAATADGFAIGGVAEDGRVRVVFDGLQATPGTGVITVGDFVVAGTPVARNTAITEAGPRVCKATAAGSAQVFKWRVVSMDGTSAVGQTGLIEEV